MYIMLNKRCESAKLMQKVALFAGFVLGLQACSLTPYEHGASEPAELVQRAIVIENGAFLVKAAVPGKIESEEIFGIPVYKRGIQPVWLEISNNSDSLARFIHYSVDHDYFSPLEVAYMHRKYFSNQGWKDLEKFLDENAMPRMIPAGETISGYVFTNATNGTKSFNVDIVHTFDDSQHEEFTFFVEVPGFVPDHAEVNFVGVYPADQIIDTDSAGLERLLVSLPCCTRNRQGNSRGQPANVVLVGKVLDVLRALLRAGWSETSYNKDFNYLNNINYIYERPPDAIFRINRGKGTERNELSLWLAPVRVDGEPVWLGQVKHAIGRRFKIGEAFFGTALDPDVDDGRNFLLQNLWYAHTLEAFAYSDTVPAVPMDQPALDFNGTPYFTDGMRVVLWVSGEPVALEDVQSLMWQAETEAAETNP